MSDLPQMAPPAPPRSLPQHAPAGRFSRPRAASLQFSLRFLLAAVTIVALASPLLPWLAVPMATVLTPWLTSVAAPICLVIAAVYSRGWPQTFFLGAAGAGLMAVFSQRAFTLAPGFESLLWAVSLLCTYGVCGALAVVTRWLIEKRGWHLSSDRDETIRQ
jgi:hypothetical protein